MCEYRREMRNESIVARIKSPFRTEAESRLEKLYNGHGHRI